MCFSLSYYKIHNVLSTEVVHVWKSDCAVNTNFPLLPLQRNVAWEGREGGRGKKKIRMEGRRTGERALGAMDPSPSLLGSSVNDFECFSLIDRSLGQSTNVVHLKLVQCK